MAEVYTYERSEELNKILKKLCRRDKVRFEATIKKLEEVCQNPLHYKNLQHDLKEFRRVHVDTSFVLVFKVDENLKCIRFEDLDHHDNIYKKWRKKV